ncbi:mechanosensitive ion channel [Brachybacterium halotolerans subsp. kimchii]|uniref:mechanosensitive ion channel n=1 Tax=Brachybacterium halotolerans TaxID=2795215 RepID=UPI001E3D09B0|nr:mechanosensitive ion channel [Brachybacterium halotolerans]UEJ81360.1 mechanosensitive ion channel [Brachybacterium halotolerans subsp. kimchii]
MNSLSNVDWAGLGLKVLAAVVVLIVTAILAAVLKSAASKLAQKVPALRRIGQDGASLGNAVGTILSMVIWLLGLVIVLGIFQLNQVLTPVTSMLEQGLGFLPNIIGAVFVFVIGLVIAKIVRALITTALHAVDFGKLLGTAQSGIQRATGGAMGDQRGTQTAGSAQGTASAQGQAPGHTEPVPQQGQATQPHPQQGQPQQGQPGQGGGKPASNIPEIIASVVFALIMIVVSIASLQILGIASISDPAAAMLTTVFTAIPNIIAAVALVGIGVLIARFVTGLFRPILESTGIDDWLQKNDVISEDSSATPTVLRIIEIAVVLFFAVMAAQVLGFPQITEILSQILNLGGSVLFGAVIIGAGFFLASVVSKLVSGTASTIIKWAIIILFAAMGLQSMGVADRIIEIAFGALVIGLAAAAVLAFGLGGRDAAARQLEKIEENKGKASASGKVSAAAGATGSSGPASSGPATGGPASAPSTEGPQA